MIRFVQQLTTLRARLALVVLAALMPAAVMIAHGYFAEREAVFARVVSEAEGQRERLSRSYREVLDSTRQLLAALARVPGFRDQSPATSELLAALKQEHPVYLNLFGNRPDGTAFASAEPMPEPVNSARSKWFQAALAADGFVVGEFREGKITGEAVLVVALAVRQAGEVKAVVGASLPLNWFDSARRGIGHAENNSVCLFDGEGQLLAHFGAGQAPDAPFLSNLAQLGRRGNGHVHYGEGAAAGTYAYGPLLETAAGQDVYLSLRLPRREALARAQRLLWWDLLQWSSVAVLGLLGAATASRRYIEHPLRRILLATSRLRGGDLSARTGVREAPDELARLAVDFDAMAEALQQRDSEQRAGTAQLREQARENVDRRRAAERRSEVIQRELQAVFERVQDVIFRMDADGRLIWATPSLERQTGYPLAEVLGRDVCACMADPDDKQRLLRALEAGGGSVHGFEVQLRRKGGGERFVAVNAQRTVAAESGEPVIEGVARDITEQVRIREELRDLTQQLETRVAERTEALERTNSELEAFTYSVSHDLRAPLRSIEGFSKLVAMRHRERLPDDGRDYLDRVQRAARRMAQLIDDLLSLSRINRYEVHLEPVDLSALAEEIVCELHAGDNGRLVEVVIAPGLTAICDRRLCRIALENLLANAWKYTGGNEHPRIELTGYEDSGGCQVFQVKDNGVGFDMQYAGKLFAPFQRLHSEEEFEGTGIGLATVMRVIQRHGGQVWAEAEPGNGAAFSFRLCSESVAQVA